MVPYQSPPGQVIHSQSVPTRPQKPKKPYFVDYRERGGNYWCPTDTGVDTEGRVYVIADETLYTELTPNTGKFKATAIPGPKDQIARRRVKYRHGEFYSRNVSKIFRFNPALKTWSSVLDAPRPFQDFDVTLAGQLLLIGVAPSPDSGTSLPTANNNKNGPHEKGAMLEIWERFGKNPQDVVELDKDDENLLDWIGGLPSYDRVWQIKDQVIILNSYTGRLAAYDLMNRHLHWIRTPWKGLTFEGVVAWDEDHRKELIQNRRAIEIGSFDSPGDGIAMYPSEWGIQVVFAQAVATKHIEGPVIPAPEEASKMPAKSVLTLNLSIPEADHDEYFRMRYGTLDLVDWKIESDASQTFDIPKGTIWFNSMNQAVDLQKFLTPPPPGVKPVSKAHLEKKNEALVPR